MKRYHLPYVILLVLSFLFHSCSDAAVLKLVKEGRSDYTIVIPAKAGKYELLAATELQKYLEEISGARLPIVGDSVNFSPKEIIIGNNRHLEELRCRVKFNTLGSDGFEIQTRDQCLVIAGGYEKGSLYGVYTFLEDWLGCRYYAPGAIHIPKQRSVVIEPIRERQVPAFDFREMYFPAVPDSSWLLWHKLDRHNSTNWGMWVHTFDDLVNPEDHFDLHPEYFSLVGGKRIDDGQLCLSNPEVNRVLTENLAKRMEQRPDVQYWSVSQNDNYLACECDGCKHLNDQYGGPSGTMIHFVNQVAMEFPDKTISTLAYQYTRKAPEGIRPEKNVNIMLCTIECNRGRPIADDPSGKAFVEDLKDWSKLTDDILLWDYVVNFRNYISPFPNFHVLQPNIQLFEDYDCRMMFQQGSGRSWSDMAELKSYIVAKLLWDPGADVDAIVNDFLQGYYGAAAPYLRQYFDMLHEELPRSGSDLWIYGYPYDAVGTFLAPSLLQEYSRLFDLAESSVEGDSELLSRVRKARLPLQFAMLDISLYNVDEKLSYFRFDEEGYVLNDTLASLLDVFVEGCMEAGIDRLQEHGTTPEEYRARVSRFVQKSIEPNLARGKPVGVLSKFSPKYNPTGQEALTDGLRGLNDYHYNWLGFEGENLVALVDLGELTTFSHLSLNFMQFERAWIFLPRSVRFFGSIDGVQYDLIGLVNNPIPDTQAGMFSLPFSIDIPTTTYRFVKVETDALRTCPDWHIGAGEKSWIFTDEIVIR